MPEDYTYVLRQVRVPIKAVKPTDIWRDGDHSWKLGDKDVELIVAPEEDFPDELPYIGVEPVQSVLTPPSEIRIPIHGTQWIGSSPVISGGAQVVLDHIDPHRALELRLSDDQVEWLNDGRAKTVVMFGQSDGPAGFYLCGPDGEKVCVTADMVRFV